VRFLHLALLIRLISLFAYPVGPRFLYEANYGWLIAALSSALALLQYSSIVSHYALLSPFFQSITIQGISRKSSSILCPSAPLQYVVRNSIETLFDSNANAKAKAWVVMVGPG
jgi:hypothetical protein